MDTEPFWFPAVQNIVSSLGVFRKRMIEPIVCVPARNEAERLPCLLQALQEQTWLGAHKRLLRTVLVLNNCDDDLRAVVQRVRPAFASCFVARHRSRVFSRRRRMSALYTKAKGAQAPFLLLGGDTSWC